ncbi:hypothetical protein CKO15_10660 [Halorhodospira abdelmalekii]|uniref:lipocalin family protein n=1 Tax=Halorhodospira abdelmalekii TaxID=421629 RepID=UPI00190382F9|nr:lipocalin family protein [Halorhodospira abdelmalekii]MBK1735733.1 hypothetical protein [Halorhodospira abdelmalekii]
MSAADEPRSSPTATPERRGLLGILRTLPRAWSKRYIEPPAGIEPVTDFDAERYLGRWYEVYRFDHGFERGATQVTAEYSLRDDGKIRVVNRAFAPSSGRWGSIEGYAVFQREPTVASLAVTFFWPITAGYHVIELDREGYQWAMVTGPSRNYLWILAREPRLDAAILAQLTARAKALGFATEGLIEVEH